jgi:hypothetical protein
MLLISLLTIHAPGAHVLFTPGVFTNRYAKMVIISRGIFTPGAFAVRVMNV